MSDRGRELFTWTGRVDREIQIAMRGRQVWTRASGRSDDTRARTRVESALPRSAGYVRVDTRDGRGDVDVIQQPSAWNDYTTIVRVRDRSSGSDRYRLTAYWESSYRDTRGNGRDDDDGWYDRGDGDWQRDRDARPRIESRDRGSDVYGDGRWGTQNTALRWSGGVDTEVEIRIQGRRVDYQSLGGAGTRDVRSTVVGDGLPRRDVQVYVQEQEGRGSVVVVQQPNAYNGYTAILRVRDPAGGMGYYNFAVMYRN
jgi:hypothetical protein